MKLSLAVLAAAAVVLLAVPHVAEAAIGDVTAVAGGALTLGVKASVKANALTSFDIVGGGKFSVVASADSDVTLSAYAAVETALPSGFSGLSVGAQAGYKLEATNGATVAANITTPALAAAAAATITGSVQAGCLRYDAEAKAYGWVDISSYDVEAKTISVPVTKVGTYVFVSVDASVRLPMFFDEAKKTKAGVMAQIAYGKGLALDLKTKSENEIKCTYATTSAEAKATTATALNVFFDFTLKTKEEVESTIRYTYNASAVAAAGIKSEAKLRFAFYNTETSKWEFPSTGASVDVEAKVVTQVTTHFSQWGVFEEPAAAAGGSAELGAEVDVKANTATSIDLKNGAKVVATATADSKVKVTAFASLTATAPKGFAALSFGTEVGFTLAATNGAKVSATFTTPPLSATAAAAITGSVKAGCLKFDAEANAYGWIDIKEYNAVTKSISVDFPEAGTYVFVSVEANARLPLLFGQARKTSNTAKEKYQFTAGLALDLKTTTQNEITVTKSNTRGTAKQSTQAGLGVFFDLSLKTKEAVDATLSYTYDSAAVAKAGIKSETSLAFAFYNEATAAWEFPATGGSVDVQAKVVTQTTAHFSKWTVYSKDDKYVIERTGAGSSVAGSAWFRTAVVAAVMLAFAFGF